MGQEGDDTVSKLPPGVAAAHFGADGTVEYLLDPHLANLRWEGVQVDSSKFKHLPPDERLYQQSQAFIDAAIDLTILAGEAGPQLTWPRASVCLYCLHLATELFLKACILRVGKVATPHHDIPELRKQYSELLPGQKNYFETPWWISAKSLNETLGFEAMEGIDRTPDQLYRYGMDRAGNPSESTHMFSPGYKFNYMKDLAERWASIWERIA